MFDRLRFPLVAVLLGAIALPGTRLPAQRAVPAPMPTPSAMSAAPTLSATPAGPTLAARSVAVRPVAAATVDPRSALASRRAFTRGQALMIIGGAALLTGAIIGGDAGTIVMLGGAGVGLYGLYLYLQ